jgi:hypothetical protein
LKSAIPGQESPIQRGSAVNLAIRGELICHPNVCIL